MNRSSQFRLALALTSVSLLAGLSACAHKTDVVQTTAPVVETESMANRAAREADAPYFVEVEFVKGSDTLTESSRSAISSLLNRARAEGTVNDVKVLSWADQEYPSTSKKKLSKDQRRLADRRNRNIKELVKQAAGSVDVDAHNMAERPGAISRWFNTPDARFKRSLVAAGLPTTADEAPVMGRASKSVVLVTIK
ncbi:hypothetical protein BH10BDE1_BH10BDE1_11560 [soil metagenome]